MEVYLTSLISLLLLLSIVVNILIYYFFKNNPIQKAEYEILKAKEIASAEKIASIENENNDIKNQLKENNDKNITIEKSNSILATEKTALEGNLEGLKKERDALSLALKAEGQKKTELEKNISSLENERKNLNERIIQHQADLERIENRFKVEFENISNKLLTTQSEQFKNSSKISIDSLINPLLTDLKNINQALLDEGKSKASLEGTIKEMVNSTKTISVQSEKLTSALKGDTKLQGNWGEIMLEKILEESGLRKDLDYILQGKEMNLKNPEDATRSVKPDVIVNLPEDKHIIVDSKISLTDYERYYSETKDSEKNEHLQKFLKSIQKHIDELADKRYQDITKLKSPEFVIMFLGVEGAYFLAVQNNPNLHSYAWDKKIVIVSPATLFATLKTISSVWRLEMQNQNSLEIAQQAGKFYDKFVSFVEDMQEIEKRLNLLSDSHSTAMKKLSEGRGNLIKRSEVLKTLGIKSSKSFSSEMLNKIHGEVDEDPSLENG